MNLTCPTSGKDYILPTKKWLQPIKELISDDISTTGRVILSNMVSDKILNNKILVKLTAGRKHRIKRFLHKMKGLPNLVTTYCVLLCQDDFLLIKENNQFCNLEDIELKNKLPEKAKKYNYSVTLELMEYYKNGSINSIEVISISEYNNIILQLIYCQLNLFSHLGYTHNDIHFGNILVKKYKKPIILEYDYINKTIQTDTEYILADYDKMFSFEYKYEDNYFHKEFENIIDLDDTSEFSTYSLYSNILSTILSVANKLKLKEKDYIKDIIYKIQLKYEEKIFDNIKKYIIEYYENKNFDLFKKNIYKDVLKFIKKFIAFLIT